MLVAISLSETKTNNNREQKVNTRVFLGFRLKVKFKGSNQSISNIVIIYYVHSRDPKSAYPPTKKTVSVVSIVNFLLSNHHNPARKQTFSLENVPTTKRRVMDGGYWSLGAIFSLCVPCVCVLVFAILLSPFHYLFSSVYIKCARGQAVRGHVRVVHHF